MDLKGKTSIWSRYDLSVGELISFALLLLAIQLTSYYNYLLFHSLAELVSIFIAVTVFIIAINSWKSIDNKYVLFVGVAYLFIGIIDLLHTLSFKGMPIFTDYDYYAPQFWIAARGLEAISMLFAFIYLGAANKLNKYILMWALGSVTAALIASILTFKVFPVCFVPGEGLTTFKKVCEYLIIGLIGVNILILTRLRERFDARVFNLIRASLVIMIAAELCFTLYISNAMNDFFNDFGHLLKVTSFFLIYKALVVTGLRDPLNLLFKNLKNSEENLREAQKLANLSRWEWNPSSDRWVWSAELYQLLNVPEHVTATSATLTDKLSTGDQLRLKSALDDALLHQSTFDIQLCFNVGEEQRYAHMQGACSQPEQNAQKVMRGTIQDVTKDHRIAETLADLKDKEKFELLLKTAGDGIHILDTDGNVVEVNDKFCKMLGYTREELLTMNVAQWDTYLTPQGIKDCAKEILANEKVFETQHTRKDGNIFDVEVSVNKTLYGRQLVIWSSSRDITERKKFESGLKLAASVFTHAHEGITITDLSGAIIDVNQAFTEITGYQRAEVIGKNPRILKSGMQSRGFYEEMWRDILERDLWSGEMWNKRKNGEVYAELKTISAVRDLAGKPQHYLSLFTDITAAKRHKEELEHIAHFDLLTDLPNRALLSDRLQNSMAQGIRRGQSLAVVFLDLDGFKVVNDKYGHELGDQLLVRISQRMQLALREGDTLSRVGGDEFVAILNDLQQAVDCEQILERMLLAASDEVIIEDIVVRVSASIGVTLYPQDHGDADQLLRHADQAMYTAKQAGKNRFHFFDLEYDQAIKTQRQKLEEVRNALIQNQLVLYYQPKVNMKTATVVGLEALIRWQHPVRGLLPPSEFLPVIEEHPLSIAVGEWVIATALRQMSTWRNEHMNIAVSVNVGARQLLQSGFASRLEQLLAAQADVPAADLELEILETSALNDMLMVAEVMRECRALGVHFALDDFGTGYSSLTYLKHLPAETLKIDQSFVRDMLDDGDDLALVRGVVGLAYAFRRSVIAEGVETKAHGDVLLAMGCELAQGYGIARPMPAGKVKDWVEEARQGIWHH